MIVEKFNLREREREREREHRVLKAMSISSVFTAKKKHIIDSLEA